MTSSTLRCGGATISTVDKEEDEGKVVYEADVMFGGKNWEIKVDPNGTLKLPEVAKAAGYSKFHFHRLFREHFGKTLKRAITEAQIDAAKDLLRKGLPPREVSERCGFASQSLSPTDSN